MPTVFRGFHVFALNASSPLLLYSSWTRALVASEPIDLPGATLRGVVALDVARKRIHGLHMVLFNDSVAFKWYKFLRQFCQCSSISVSRIGDPQ